MDWMLTRAILASCAASFMLFGAFALFTASSVALYGAWRGLRSLRRGLPPQAAMVQGYVSLARTKTHDTTGAVVEPQIRFLSMWAGLLAALAALFSLGSDEADTGPGRGPSEK
jgi:hypothetical protein